MTPLARTSALITGLACLVLGVLSLTGPAVPDEHWGTRGSVVNGTGLIAFAAMAVALELLTPLLTLGRVGHVGQRLAQAGLALMVVESVVSQVHGGNTWGPVFTLGLLLTLVGLLLVAIDGLRRQRWLAPLPFLGLFIAIGSGDHGGFLLLGAIWTTLGAITPASRRIATP